MLERAAGLEKDAPPVRPGLAGETLQLHEEGGVVLRDQDRDALEPRVVGAKGEEQAVGDLGRQRCAASATSAA